MIYDTLGNLNRYVGKSINLDKVIAFIQSQDLTTLRLGRNDIDSEVYVMVFNNHLVPEAPITFEMHHLFADLHITFGARETVRFAPFEQLRVTRPYDPQDEALLGEAWQHDTFLIDGQHFAIFFPGEPHAVKGYAGDDEVKKLVFKFKI